jgi:K(+)-stimulated pyrophosphate-energized sodium pump
MKVGLTVALICFLALGWAMWQSKRESEEMKQVEATLENAKDVA